jgi:hypothetical protein
VPKKAEQQPSKDQKHLGGVVAFDPTLEPKQRLQVRQEPQDGVRLALGQRHLNRVQLAFSDSLI